jgi:hypothetical protein
MFSTEIFKTSKNREQLSSRASQHLPNSQDRLDTDKQTPRVQRSAVSMLPVSKATLTFYIFSTTTT